MDEAKQTESTKKMSEREVQVYYNQNEILWRLCDTQPETGDSNNSPDTAMYDDDNDNDNDIVAGID